MVEFVVGWRGFGVGYDGDGVPKGRGSEGAGPILRFRLTVLGSCSRAPAQAAAVRTGCVLLMRSTNIAVCRSYTRVHPVQVKNAVSSYAHAW